MKYPKNLQNNEKIYDIYNFDRPRMLVGEMPVIFLNT